MRNWIGLIGKWLLRPMEEGREMSLGAAGMFGKKAVRFMVFS
jgi:hypothetical protein